MSEPIREERSLESLALVRSAVTDLIGSVRRTALVLLLLMAAFEFINETPRESIVLGGFQITKGSIVLQLIPALASYLYLQLATDTAKYYDLAELFLYEVRTGVKNFSGHKGPDLLFAALAPASPLFWDPFGRFIFGGKNGKPSIDTFAASTFSILITLGFLAFEAQSYYILLPAHLIPITLLWGASLIVTVFCLVITVILSYSI